MLTQFNSSGAAKLFTVTSEIQADLLRRQPRVVPPVLSFPEQDLNN